MIDVHARLIRHLEQYAGLDREVEFIPSEEAINERKVNHQGLVAPELAVVMAYCKIRLFMRLLDSDLPEDEYLGHDLERYFPPPLPERYSARMRGHRLRREIISTVVANQLVDRAGMTFAFRLGEETGAAAVAAGPRLRGRRARYSTCARSGRRSRTSTTRSRPGRSCRC